MQTISLSPEYTDLVVRGLKTTTVRAGSRDYRMGPAVLDVGAEKLPIEITGTRFSSFGFLTEADARSDGFESAALLRDALLRFYPALRPSDTVTIVQFRYLGQGARR